MVWIRDNSLRKKIYLMLVGVAIGVFLAYGMHVVYKENGLAFIFVIGVVILIAIGISVAGRGEI